MLRIRAFFRWFIPGVGIIHWLSLVGIGFIFDSIGLAFALIKSGLIETTNADLLLNNWPKIVVTIIIGLIMMGIGVFKITHHVFAPYRRHQAGRIVDVVRAHTKRQKGIKVVAIGGGTGLPSVLRGFKPYTSNITAVVTVADDGGSSGRLRKDFGVLPPGDLRNNIVALADDESMMTHLFQYRFNNGDLEGHAFGNLFITAMTGVTGSLEAALAETERVLNIQGRVLPSTLDNVNLVASVKINQKNHIETVHGESQITNKKGKIEKIWLDPDNVQPYEQSVSAIIEADVVVIGPGSLYTSILPNLLVDGIREALSKTAACKIYVCNVATQPGETDNYNVADHVYALEEHIGRGIFQAVIANNAYPTRNAGINTNYVKAVAHNHEIAQRYHLHYADLTDENRPWRHDPQKLSTAILAVSDRYAQQTLNTLTDMFTGV